MNPILPIGAILGLFFLLENSNSKVAKMLNDLSRERLKRKTRSLYPSVDFSNWVVIGLRGMLPDEKGNLILNDNKENEWNDCFVLIKNNETKVYQGSVDPGTYWMKSPMKGLEKRGTARQEPQLMNLVFSLIKGKPALLVESLLIKRDSNRNGIHDESDKIERADRSNGIFIHAMYTEGKVERNSAGCGVLKAKWNSREWKDFYDTLSKSGQAKIKYALIEGRNV